MGLHPGLVVLAKVQLGLFSHPRPPRPPSPPPARCRRMLRLVPSQIIGYTKSVLVELLESSPPNLQAFMGQAEEMGMLR